VDGLDVPLTVNVTRYPHSLAHRNHFFSVQSLRRLYLFLAVQRWLSLVPVLNHVVDGVGFVLTPPEPVSVEKGHLFDGGGLQPCHFEA
jgi:hypothetical protein